jgi:uncharacterized protein YbcI
MTTTQPSADAAPVDGPAADQADNHLNAAISNAVVRRLVEHTGKGPTRARTTIDGDTVVCVVRGTLTKGEKTLAYSGMQARVRKTRDAIHDVMRSELIKDIQRLTGRKVLALLAAQEVIPDVASAVFVLEPEEAALCTPPDLRPSPARASTET